MLHFDAIGFWPPMILATFYLPRAIASVPYSYWILFFIAGALSYSCPIPNPNGVGIWPFYLLLAIANLAIFILKSGDFSYRLPVGPTFGLGFLSIVIPDAFLTYSRYGTGGIVGAMGLNDGLILFGLLPALVAVFFWGLIEWGFSKDRMEQFSLRKSLAFHLSPNPSLQRIASGSR